ncbi:hypothetical protein GO988_06160 [Hymenobacter sp. HMF4947]|uniref:Glycosyltransferase RgtA/B/C/D-like domain-containing protein n=1 Tax=Hymenobacter ginkgonis TaxID=2682976 RepID=A0A7K1TBX0_9BACT|nr:hypothetical protein [Hymenobacter ginkgonis]MVN75906.1 hypothetical protein [Hymenobacter ginkgonis]
MPAQLLVLLVLVLALRLPLIWFGLPVSAAELRLLLLGEGVGAGAWPYRDLYDGTAPLAAAAGGVLQLAWDRPVLLYRALALLLLLTQALRLNAVLNRADVHPERGYLAGLTYLVVASLTTDLDTLSPLLLGHTFIIFALSALLPTSREGYDNRRLFRAGFLIGLAALCYLPLALFVGLGLFAVLIFAANSFRSALLLVCGFLSPYALVATVFLYVGALPNFAHQHLERGLGQGVAGLDGMPPAVAWPLLALPVLLLLLGLLRAGATALGLVFQAKFRQLMLVWMLLALAVLAVGKGVAPGSAVLLLPPLTYFSLFLWQKVPGRLGWLPELVFLLLLGSVVALRYRAQVPGLQTLLRLPAESELAPQPARAYVRLAPGRAVLVLGPDRRPFLDHPAAQPYLDWPLAQVDFNHLNEYAAVVRVARNLGPQPPSYIIDQQGLVPQLRHLLPTLFGPYKAVAGRPGVYQR